MNEREVKRGLPRDDYEVIIRLRDVRQLANDLIQTWALGATYEEIAAGVEAFRLVFPIFTFRFDEETADIVVEGPS